MASTKSPFNFDAIGAHVKNRNAFDISYSTLFTSPCGMILPAYVEEVLAGDYIDLGMENFTRTQPAVAPAFVNFDEKVDFYYVPFRLLWSLYDSWRLGTNLYQKSGLGNGSSYDFDSLPLSLPSDLQLPSQSYKFMFYALFCATTSEGTAIPYYSNPDIWGYWTCFSTWRMFDLLGYGAINYEWVKDKPLDVGSLDDTSVNGVSLHVNLFRALAYQCIAQHFYRNEDFEPLVPQFYNLDMFTSIRNGFDFNLSTSGQVAYLNKLFVPDYKCFRKDRFNSVKPINGFGFNALEVYDFGFLSSLWNSYVNDKEGTGGSIESGDFNFQVEGKTAFVESYLPPKEVEGVQMARLTPNDLRILLAQDSLLRSMVYSKKDYASLREAELGISSRNFDVPQYLGTHMNAITLSDVEGTATTDHSQLGELAGKGIGGNSSHVFKKEFEEDGVIIGMHYIMPRNNYNSNRIDRRNHVLSRYDLPMPQFDNLGLQPIWMWEYGIYNELANIDLLLDPSSESSDNWFGASFGFEARYGEYKSRVNEIHGIFRNGLSLDYWTLSTNVKDVYSSDSKWSAGILGDQFFKCRPNITDQIFNVAFDGTESTDPFMCSMTFHVTRVSNMSVMGVPSVNVQI